MKRGVLSEDEFVKANEVARSQSTGLETRRDELSQWLEEQRNRVSTAERLPGAILKTAHVYRDDRIELEFRG